MDLDAESTATLNHDQMARIATYGRRREVRPGEILFGPGEANQPLVVLESATVDIERPATPDAPARLLTSHGPGRFLGELNLLTGQAPYLVARVRRAGVVILVPPDQLRRLMRQDADLSDRLLRTFIARRTFLRTGEGARSLEILGSRWSRECAALRSWAARQQLPHLWLELDTPEGAALADAIGAQATDLPVAIALGQLRRRATPPEVAALLGLEHRRGSSRHLHTLVVIGAGPAGLAGAVCAASEGLDTVLLEGHHVGGQAAASSRIENYVGFPSGISGGDLTNRALIQAMKFGASVSGSSAATSLSAQDGNLLVGIGTDHIRTRAVLITTGATYNRLPLTNWDRYDGTSIFYAATEIEARACASAPVVVVGGANSAGQAAIFLADHGSPVTLVVRGTDLDSRMSRYLVGRVEAHPGITIRTGSRVTELHGSSQLDGVTIAASNGLPPAVPGSPAPDTLDDRDGSRTSACAGLFCFIGATPSADFATGVARDQHGFIRTDRDLTDEDLGPGWQLLGRMPLPYETSIPGVFAAGDVRSGSVKRVAAAVGEGSAAVSAIHQALSVGTTV